MSRKHIYKVSLWPKLKSLETNNQHCFKGSSSMCEFGICLSVKRKRQEAEKGYPQMRTGRLWFWRWHRLGFMSSYWRWVWGFVGWWLEQPELWGCAVVDSCCIDCTSHSSAWAPKAGCVAAGGRELGLGLIPVLRLAVAPALELMLSRFWLWSWGWSGLQHCWQSHLSPGWWWREAGAPPSFGVGARTLVAAAVGSGVVIL